VEPAEYQSAQRARRHLNETGQGGGRAGGLRKRRHCARNRVRHDDTVAELEKGHRHEDRPGMPDAGEQEDNERRRASEVERETDRHGPVDGHPDRARPLAHRRKRDYLYLVR